MADDTRQARATAAYYAKAAAAYDDAHAHGGDEHYEALAHVATIAAERGARSILDVGCGTGRATLFLRERGLDVHGIDPSPEMLERAIAKGLPRDRASVGRGESLPFEAGGFDAAVACGIMHHVSRPDAIVREMMRVARRAVFISDSNRFGQGGLGARRLKLVLWRLGLWRAARWLSTRGRGFTYSDDDGYIYSFSVFDVVSTVARWPAVVQVIPTGRKLTESHLPDILRSSHGLVVAIKSTPAVD